MSARPELVVSVHVDGWARTRSVLVHLGHEMLIDLPSQAGESRPEQIDRALRLAIEHPSYRTRYEAWQRYWSAA